MAKWKNTKNHWSKTDKKESVLKKFKKLNLKKDNVHLLKRNLQEKKCLDI